MPALKGVECEDDRWRQIRFLLLQRERRPDVITEMSVVQNWIEELK